MNGVRVDIAETAEDAGRRAADHVRGLLDTGRPVLGIATGSSPQALYRALAAQVRAGRRLDGVSAFALDEYVGIDRRHPQSYHAIVARDVTGPLDLDPADVHVPDGQATDPAAAAEEYEIALADAAGVEVQILGVGGNGHIGFNEPGSRRESRTRVVRLARATRAANSRFFASETEVPRAAITQGVATILSAAHLVLVADGAEKARIVAAAVRGPVGPDVPASFVREHPDAVLFLDREAARFLD